MKAQVIEGWDRDTLHRFIATNIDTGTLAYTDDFKAYRQLKSHDYQFVRHSLGEYVNETVHTNGMESFWGMLKRAHKGDLSQNECQESGSVFERVCRTVYNIRELDTIEQMVECIEGKRLSHRELVHQVDEQ